MAKGLKTDGPEFTRTLCAVLVELDSMRDQCIAEERGLVNARKKLEKDLGKLGEDESPESNRVRVAFTKVIMALKNCRAQIERLNDQICRGLKFGQQPMLIQAEQEGRIRELIASKEDAQHSLELWKSTSAESRKVGSQTGEGEEGPVGEPDGDDDEEGETESTPAPLGRSSSLIDDALRAGDRCHIVKQADGELVAEGEFETFMPKVGAATVRVRGSIVRFELEERKLAIVKAPGAATEPAPAPSSSAELVRVTHLVTGEVKGEGVLEVQTFDYALVLIKGQAKAKRFALDVYSVEPVKSEAGIAAMVKGEIHESKPAAQKPAKGGKKKPARA